MSKRTINGGAAVGAILGAALFALLIAPVAVMLGTDYLHEHVPAIPELGFVPSVVACLTARALLGTSRRSASPAA